MIATGGSAGCPRRAAARGPAQAGAGHRLDRRRCPRSGTRSWARCPPRGAAAPRPLRAAARPEADQALLADELAAWAAAAARGGGCDRRRRSTTGPGPAPRRRTGPRAAAAPPNVRSRRPSSTRSMSPSSLAPRESCTSTPGHACAEAADDRRQDPGADALVDAHAQRARLAPAAYASRSARAACEARRRSLDMAQQELAGLGELTVRRPRERSNSRTPSAPSSATTCWLTADCV